MKYVVTFKTEMHDDQGNPVGHVRITDTEAMKADPVMDGHTVGMPYGYQPDWIEDKGWLPIAEAQTIAAEYGVELRVS